MNPRDVGFAFAARKLLGGQAASVAEYAPRGSGAITALLERVSPDALAGMVCALRNDAGAVLDGIHASWLASALLEERKRTVHAVVRSLPEGMRAEVVKQLAGFGYALDNEQLTSAGGALALLDADAVLHFRERHFADLSADTGPPASPVLEWLIGAGARELRGVARELGLRSVARAFCMIGRNDLAKLCHGVPAQDSVRLVASVVELNDELSAEELEQLQRRHLGVINMIKLSPEVFADVGLACIALAWVRLLPPGGCAALCCGLPEPMGRRLRQLQASNPFDEERYLLAFREEVMGWYADLVRQGVIAESTKES